MTRIHAFSLSAALMASTTLSSTSAIAQEFETDENVISLATIVVRAINDGGANVTTTEAANTAGSRVPVDPQLLPRALSVVPREFFEAQGARTLEETVAYAPGLATGLYGQDDRYEEFAIRGFEAQIGGAYRDGMPLRTVDWAAWRSEPFGLESVNVLRGPTSDLYGANQPGGLINGVSKRPSFTFGGEIRATVTDENGREVGVDVTGPLSENVAYRFVGLVNDSGTAFDGVDTSRIYLAPSLTFAPTDQTTFTIYGQYQKDDVGDTYVHVPQYGSLYDNPLGEYKRGLYTGDPDDRTIKTTQHYVGYELSHEFAPSWTFTSRARHADNDWENYNEFPAAFVNFSYLMGAPVGLPTAIDTVVLTKFDVDQTATQSTFDNSVLYDFATGNAMGKVTFGVDYFDVSNTTDFAYGYSGERNLQTGVSSALLTGAVPGHLPNRRETDIEQLGIYASGHAEIGDRWVLNGGLRHDKVEQKTRGFTTGLAGVQPIDNTIDESFTSANLGFGYRLNPDLMAYAGFGRSFNLPVSGEKADGSGLGLEKAKSFELGLRFTSADARSNFNVALYNIDKTDVAYQDPSSGNQFVYIQAGKVRSRGIELEASHDFGNGLSLFGSMDFIDTEVLEDPNYKGNKSARVPSFSAAVFAEYEVQSVDGLAFGLGLRHTGSRYSDIANTKALELDSVTLVDASVSYEVNDWQLLLAARNLADKEYLGYCGPSFLSLGAFDPSGTLDAASGTCVYGAGREVTFTARRRF